MTTPTGYPQVYPLTTTPLQVWMATPNATVGFENTSVNNNVWISYTSNIQPGASNAFQLAPLESVTLTTSQTVWAVTDNIDGNGSLLQVLPGGTNISLSPSQIAQVIDVAGLATAIALDILATGVSLVSAPTLLWGSGAGGGGGGGSAGTNIFGAHVPPGAYPQFSANDWTSAANFWDTVVGAPIASHQIRWYYEEGQFDTTLAALTQTWPGLINWINGTTDPNPSVIISYRPDRTGALPGGTLNSHGTAQAALLASALAMLKASFPNVSWSVCLFHEAQGKDANGNRRFPYTYTDNAGTHTITFVDYMKAYGPTVTAAAVSNFVYICLPSSEQVNNCFSTVFWSGTNVEGYTQICADYYGVDSYTGGVRLNAGSWGLSGNTTGLVGVSQALTNPLPIGLTEVGASVGTHPPQATYSAYIDHIIAVFSALPTKLQGGPMNWYQGAGAGANVVQANGSNTDGVSLVGSPSAGDGIIAWYNALSVQPGSGGQGSGTFTVAAGATAIPAPIKPTPGGGYAIANGLSYDISIIGLAGAASTIPFVTVQMKWKNTDITGAKSIHEERWTIPLGVSTSTGTVITGRGPMHGQFLSIHVVNRDTDTATITMQVNQTGRPVSQHDWQWDAINSVNIPGYNLPGGSPFSNSLGSINNVNVPASPGQITRLLSMFSGEVYMKMSASGAGQLNYVLNPQPSSVFGSAAIFNDTNPASGELLTPTMKLPRGPVQVTVNNNSAGALGAFMEVIALDRG